MGFRRGIALLFVLALLAAACGDSSGGDIFAEAGGGGDESSDQEDFAEAFGSALGAGGSGNINFDGVDHPIASVFCQLDADVDLGTVGDDGFRMFITEGSSGWNTQILDADSLQWFGTDEDVQQNGSSFRGSDMFWNNSNDTTVNVEYEVNCP